jgi:prevent-host-death family protein
MTALNIRGYANKGENYILIEKAMNVQYIVNEKGKQTAVVVPIDEWRELKATHEKLLNKLAVLDGLQDALEEVQEIKQGKRNKGRTLGEFLNEM